MQDFSCSRCWLSCLFSSSVNVYYGNVPVVCSSLKAPDSCVCCPDSQCCIFWADWLNVVDATEFSLFDFPCALLFFFVKHFCVYLIRMDTFSIETHTVLILSRFTLYRIIGLLTGYCVKIISKQSEHDCLIQLLRHWWLIFHFVIKMKSVKCLAGF